MLSKSIKPNQRMKSGATTTYHRTRRGRVGCGRPRRNQRRQAPRQTWTRDLEIFVIVQGAAASDTVHLATLAHLFV